jgi:hypothetical protein
MLLKVFISPARLVAQAQPLRINGIMGPMIPARTLRTQCSTERRRRPSRCPALEHPSPLATS